MIGQDCHSHQSRRGKCDQGRQEAPDDVQRFPHLIVYGSEKRENKGMGSIFSEPNSINCNARLCVVYNLRNKEDGCSNKICKIRLRRNGCPQKAAASPICFSSLKPFLL